MKHISAHKNTFYLAEVNVTLRQELKGVTNEVHILFMFCLLSCGGLQP